MFGIFRKKPPPRAEMQNDAEIVQARFNRVIELYYEKSGVEQMAISHGVAFAWKLFDANTGGFEKFGQLDRASQQAYVIKAGDFEKAILEERKDPQLFVGFNLFRMFLATVVDGDESTARQMGDKIAPIVAKGAPLVGLAL